MPWTIWASVKPVIMVSGFLYRAETGQGPCTSPFVLSGGTTIFHATLFSHTPSRTKCWRSLFCRRVCLLKQLDENVATLHLPSHGAAITVCAQEHADHVGVMFKGSFAQRKSSFFMFAQTLSSGRNHSIVNDPSQMVRFLLVLLFVLVFPRERLAEVLPSAADPKQRAQTREPAA